jgi:hypothetical protein
VSNDRYLAEIAAALASMAKSLEAMAPISPADATAIGTADAYHWNAEGGRLMPVEKVAHVPLSLLKGIDQVQDILLRNTEQFARGHGANNTLLWGARGMGKSSLVKAVHADILARRFFCKLQVVPEMPRLGRTQTEIEVGNLAILEHGRQCLKTFARTRFDECTDNQRIDQARRFMRAHRAAQSIGVTRWRQVTKRHAACLGKLQHLFEVPQLFPCETRHAVHQARAIGITKQQIQRRRRGLLFAMRVIDKNQRQVCSSGSYPFDRRAAPQELCDGLGHGPQSIPEPPRGIHPNFQPITISMTLVPVGPV